MPIPTTPNLSIQRMRREDQNKEEIFNLLADLVDLRVGKNPLATVYHSANQSLVSATWTALAFDTELEDTDGMHDTAANTSRITIRTAGRYAGIAVVPFAPTAAGIRIARPRLNGTTVIDTPAQIQPTAGYYAVVTLGLTARLYAVGDYVEVQAYQDAGAALNVIVDAPNFYYPRFSMWKVG